MRSCSCPASLARCRSDISTPHPIVAAGKGRGDCCSDDNNDDGGDGGGGGDDDDDDDSYFVATFRMHVM